MPRASPRPEVGPDAVPVGAPFLHGADEGIDRDHRQDRSTFGAIAGHDEAQHSRDQQEDFERRDRCA